MNMNIGAQYYTVRDSIKTIKDFNETCRKISDIGYKLIQISASPLPAKEMREITDSYGLKVALTHRSFPDFEKDIDEVIEYKKTLGSDICGLGMMPLSYGENAQTLSDFINKANTICEKLRRENMYFGYHNHSFEFAKIDGKLIMDYLIDETDPEIFNFIADTYWIQLGGKDPADYISDLGKRAIAVHFKDYKIQQKSWTTPSMAEVGLGNLDWDAITDACCASGCRFAFVEQDICERDPFESLAISYNYLKGKGFC